MEACQRVSPTSQGAALQHRWHPRHAAKRQAAPSLRPLQPAAAEQRERDSRPAEAPAVPAVGWLWDKKAADTRKRLQEQNLRPKK